MKIKASKDNVVKLAEMLQMKCEYVMEKRRVEHGMPVVIQMVCNEIER